MTFGSLFRRRIHSRLCSIFLLTTMLPQVQAFRQFRLALWPRRRVINTVTRSGLSSKPDFQSEATAKYFDHGRLERDIYKWWEENNLFAPNSTSAKNGKPFVVPMPPPNVTGFLHMGHALFVAIQDLFVRFQRMRGRRVLWLPGTDHAGIATQMLVEKAIVAEGSSREALGREEFIRRVWQWKDEKGGRITAQMRRLGASADWSREKFTLDAEFSGAVAEAFKMLFDRGLVYRGNYMVNWSPALRTAVSDLEVDYADEEATLYYFKYRLAGPGSSSESGEAEFIPVATTRPETVFGDAAVCVHPLDERYARFIGRRVVVPTTDRTIPGEAFETYDITPFALALAIAFI
jgi:valyl-tRNA synthetase